MGKQTLPDAARQGQSLHQARVQSIRCTSKNPCGDWYAIDANGNRIEKVPPEPASPFIASHDPLASISLSDPNYDEENARAFTEAFYALFGDTMPRSTLLRYLPFMAESARRLYAEDQPFHALLYDRYTLGRSVRAMCERYGWHHDMLDASLRRALHRLRDYMADAQHMAAVEAC